MRKEYLVLNSDHAHDLDLLNMLQAGAIEEKEAQPLHSVKEEAKTIYEQLSNTWSN